MIFKVNTRYSGKVNLKPHVELYSVKDFMGKDLPGLAITLTDADTSEPFTVLTKSFGEFIGCKNAAYIDTNNCPYAKQLLQEGIAMDTGIKKLSGYCQYPLWVFSEQFLKEHGAENYQKYSDAYDEYMGIKTAETEPDLVENEDGGIVMNQ